jgi:hypothetical protein
MRVILVALATLVVLAAGCDESEPSGTDAAVEPESRGDDPISGAGKDEPGEPDGGSSAEPDDEPGDPPVPDEDDPAPDQEPGATTGTELCALCHASAECDSEADVPRCRCKAGFEHEGGARSACVDIDECERDEDDCSAHASCTNTRGGFECDCDEGYAGDGKRCDDVDE